MIRFSYDFKKEANQMTLRVLLLHQYLTINFILIYQFKMI